MKNRRFSNRPPLDLEHQASRRPECKSRAEILQRASNHVRFLDGKFLMVEEHLDRRNVVAPLPEQYRCRANPALPPNLGGHRDLTLSLHLGLYPAHAFTLPR